VDQRVEDEMRDAVSTGCASESTKLPLGLLVFPRWVKVRVTGLIGERVIAVSKLLSEVGRGFLVHPLVFSKLSMSWLGNLSG
jgi:hypothetical protein